MHRYEELERLYYKRLKKRYFIRAFFGVLSVMIVVFLYKINSQIPHKKINKTIISKSKEKNITHENNKTKEISQLKNNIKISKKANIDKNKTIKKAKQIPLKKLELNPIYPTINTETIKQPQKIVKKPPKTLKIIVKSQTETIDNLTQIYQAEPDYQVAMRIAHLYFDKQDYQKSIEWAKKANKLKPEDDESWLLFAQSLLKLNKKQKAKEVLIAYLSTYGASEKIENLLRSIK